MTVEQPSEIEEMKAFTPKSGDVVVVRMKNATREAMERAKGLLHGRLPRDVSVIVCDDAVTNVEVFSTEQVKQFLEAQATE
jgi:hypothetical protein